MSMEEQAETPIYYGKRVLCGQVPQYKGNYVRVLGKVEQSVEGSFFLRSEQNPTESAKVVIENVLIDPETMPIVEVFGQVSEEGYVIGEVVYPCSDFSLFLFLFFFLSLSFHHFYSLFFLFSFKQTLLFMKMSSAEFLKFQN